MCAVAPAAGVSGASGAMLLPGAAEDERETR